jgi:hypothetical protein
MGNCYSCYSKELSNLQINNSKLQIDNLKIKNEFEELKEKYSKIQQNYLEENQIIIDDSNGTINATTLYFYYNDNRLRYSKSDFVYIIEYPYNFIIYPNGLHNFYPSNNFIINITEDLMFDIELPINWVNECFEIYKLEGKNNIRKSILFENQGILNEKNKKLFNINDTAVKLMDNNKYNDALNLLLDNYPRIIPEHLKMKKHFLYNITSCYSILKNKEKTIEYLEKLFEVDNNIWVKIIMNTDLDEFKYTIEFVNLMRKVINIKKVINKNYNLSIVGYLENYIYN